MKGNIFSPEDKEFMETVQSDLRRYLQKNIFPSRTVLVFPPFNGFRRFLIHKLIEDNFASSEVAAFSIGQDINRRIVICYKGLISEAAKQGLPATIPQPPRQNMIDKEKPSRQRQTPTAAVYRPPAARQAENRKSRDDLKLPDTKQTRVRRPDQQMYVPRPKRASYGNDLPRSRSRSDSRLSMDSDQSSEKQKTASVNSEETRVPNQNGVSKDCQESFSILSLVRGANDNISEVSIVCNSKEIQHQNEVNLISDNSSDNVDSIQTTKTVTETKTNTGERVETAPEPKERSIDENAVQEIVPVDCPSNSELKNIKDSETQVNEQSVINTETSDNNTMLERCTHSPSQPKKNIDSEEDNTEAMETISISSDNKSEDSSGSSSSNSGSKTSDSSADNKGEEKCSKNKNTEKMDLDHVDCKSARSKTKSRRNLKEEKTKSKVKTCTIAKASEVLVISDTSSSDDSMKSAVDDSENIINNDTLKSQQPSKVNDKLERSAKHSKIIDPDDCDWESLYDDSGECLVPSLLEELTKSVGRVKVTSADSDYRPFQSIEERTNDGECIIEIYDFPAEFKTTDLFNIFAAYRNKNFQIKWVDDTHALGIFPSPLMADEVLACTLPFVKTRPLRLGIAESRTKARNLVLPPLPAAERPKTCTALARRLVTGALGLRIPTSSQEREREKQVLKEAREKRRQEAKQREAAWEGTITSSSAI